MKPTIAVIEPGGLNLELAVLFAREGYETIYFSEHHEASPMGYKSAIGSGFDGVRHELDLADALDDADVIVCPDTHSQSYAKLAAQYGKPCFAAGESEQLEQDRLFFKKLLQKLSLPVAPYDHGKGVEELEKHLRAVKDRFIKFPGKYRGAVETIKHVDWSKTRHEFWGQLLTELGGNQDIVDWISETPIDLVAEVAYDGLTVNGEFSRPGLVGIEAKDASYAGQIMADIPDLLKPCHEKLSPFLKEWQAKTAVSIEGMIAKDGQFFPTDPCLRFGHPVSSVQLCIFSNLCEWIVAAANGENIPIKTESKWGAAIEIKSDCLEENWVEVMFPDKLRPYVKLQNAKKEKGCYYVVPKSFLAATAVGLGDTLKEAIETCLEVADQVECDGKHLDIDSLHCLRDETIPAAKEAGIPFTP